MRSAKESKSSEKYRVTKTEEQDQIAKLKERIAYLEKIIRGRSSSSKVAVFISDIHAGSMTAVSTPEPEVGEGGGSYKPRSNGNWKLINGWPAILDKVREVTNRYFDVTCLLGEPIDGPNPKQGGSNVWSVDINDQLKDAQKLFMPYYQATKTKAGNTNFIAIRGSDYHVRHGGTPYEEMFASSMSFTRYKGAFKDDSDFLTLSERYINNNPGRTNKYAEKRRQVYEMLSKGVPEDQIKEDMDLGTSGLYFMKKTLDKIQKEQKKLPPGESNYFKNIFDEALKTTAKQHPTGELSYDSPVNGTWTDYYAFFSLADKLFCISHNVGFNKWQSYRTTAINREHSAMIFEAGKYYPRDRKLNYNIRGHVHYFAGTMFIDQFACTLPCWKAPDGHLYRGGVGGTAPDFGVVALLIEPNGFAQVYPIVLENEKYPMKTKILDFDGSQEPIKVRVSTKR